MEMLNDILARATREHWAVPHCNVATLDQLEAVAATCATMRSPVMVGTSEGERDFIGPARAVALVRVWRQQGAAVFLNADHTRSVERAKEAIDAGYESVHIDLSKESLEDNIQGTKEVVSHARAQERDIAVEGEVGYLPTDSSRVYKEEVAIDPDSLTKPDEAERFVRETGVNRFAPAVGNLHGIAANEPNINTALVRTLRETLPDSVALVMHGGSGISERDMKEAITAGIANIHVSTQLRIAWRAALAETLASAPDEYAPYRLLSPARDAVSRVVADIVKLCGSEGKV